ncbi:MAG: tetratricopeptide repeat protein [Lewinellaceae bacterium]|nr:tetratricopeptide repeat protein [Phaeodactylibacter sp.]MCB9348257.1 tetratricopeptide repeat protein [Lewinellaceae bacterium]
MYTSFGDYDTALQYLQKSLKIRQKIGDISSMAVTLHNLGTLSFEQEHFEQAVAPIFQAYRIFEQIGSPNAQSSLGYLNAIAEKIGAYYLLNIDYNEEGGGGWMEEEDYELGDFAPLRDDILNGDYRALYLAWAYFSQTGEEEEEEHSYNDAPPVPPNLKHMTAALKAFIDFFEIDGDLITAAQSVSPDSRASEVDYNKLLLQLPEKERNDWLFRLLKGEPRLELLLKKRLEKLSPKLAGPAQPELSPAELRKLSAEKEQERRAREKAEAQAAHISRMKILAGQEADLWKSVMYNIERKTGKSYGLATESLKDLKALAVFQGKEAAFQAKMEELRQQYARRTGLMDRWKNAGL